jgi:hypothetical protein
MRRQLLLITAFLRRYRAANRCVRRLYLGNLSASGYSDRKPILRGNRPGARSQTKSAFSVINRASKLLFFGFAILAVAMHAEAARIGVLSNQNAAATAADFAGRLTGHTFTAVETGTVTPALASLVSNFDAVLLFEDGLFTNAPNIGNVVAQFAQTGRPVVLGSFYEQDRTTTTSVAASGWGALESLDPNISDGFGTAYSARSLNPTSLVLHPLTYGVHTLTAHQYAGGNQAKPGTIVLARWAQPNAHGEPDPAIALRFTGNACIMHIAIAADYSSYGAYGSVYGGDFYRLWQNAFDFAAAKCVVGADQIVDAGALPAPLRNGTNPVVVPALANSTLLLLSLLLAAAAVGALRRRD